MRIKVRFHVFVAVICVQVYMSSCDDLVPMLTDGEFTQAVAIIESKISEIPTPSEGAIVTELTEVADGDSFNYFAEEDPDHPIFTRVGGNAGEKFVVLSRGEDHFMREDRNNFAVLVQTSGNKYALKTAYIDDLDSGGLEWFHAMATTPNGAEIVLELFGNHEHEESPQHCHWFGQTMIMCSKMTLQEKTERRLLETGGGDDYEGNALDSSGSSGSGYSSKSKKDRRPIGEGLTIPDGSEWKNKNSGGGTSMGGGDSSSGGGMGGGMGAGKGGMNGDGGMGSGKGGVNGDGGIGSGKGGGKGSGSGNGGMNGDGRTGGGKGGANGEEGESEEQIFITLKAGDKSKAKGRKLGTMMTHRGRATPPNNKVSKRQSPPQFRPRYHPMW